MGSSGRSRFQLVASPASRGVPERRQEQFPIGRRRVQRVSGTDIVTGAWRE